MPAQVPYFKQGGSIGTDPWNMKGEGEHAGQREKERGRKGSLKRFWEYLGTFESILAP